jgi:hypothetical protein
MVDAYLRADPGGVVVVAPRGLDRLRQAVADPTLATRIVTWRTP